MPDATLQGLRELSLFTGVGGGLLASRLLHWTPVAYVENDPACLSVLRARIQDGVIPDAPIHTDIRYMYAGPYRSQVDVVSAGFPAQPYDMDNHDANNRWSDTIRIIREVRPRYAFLENLPGMLAGTHGFFGRVLGDLAESGFDAVWTCVPASRSGAPYTRDRLWILAYERGTPQPSLG